MATIYKITNTINHKSYVGFTTQEPAEKRWVAHKYLAQRGSQTYFHRAIRKYGNDSFLFGVVEEGLDPGIGKDIREPYWISVLAPEYNMTVGGEGTLGWVPSKETRAKISASKIGIPCPMTPESRARNIASLKGIHKRKITCPNCQKIGGSNSMRRWHFENCRKRQ